VRRRAEARSGHNYRLADGLKAEIEAAGWRVIDHGKRTSVNPAAPASVEIGGEMRYGSAAAVPSPLEQPATVPWTVVTVAGEEPERFTRLMTALRTHAPAGTQVVVVANDPSAAQEAALQPGSADIAPIGDRRPEVLRTSVRLGYAAALNVGLSRSEGELVLIADATAVPAGDAFGPLAAALGDPAVAAAGGFGLIVDDPEEPRANLLHRTTGAEGDGDVMALEMAWLAFRRSELAASHPSPLDEHFVTAAWLDVWWTLRLRFGAPDGASDDERSDGSASTGNEAASSEDEAAPAVPTRDEESAAAPARRAAAVSLPLFRAPAPWPPDRTRLNRRNMYRVLDAFGWVELR